MIEYISSRDDNDTLVSVQGCQMLPGNSAEDLPGPYRITLRVMHRSNKVDGTTYMVCEPSAADARALGEALIKAADEADKTWRVTQHNVNGVGCTSYVHPKVQL